jgi:energy-coupling factor transporter ATP-binding protein EcfA2
MTISYDEAVSFETTQIFTPTSPARVSFVERAGPNEKLVAALKTPGKQLVVYGHSGTGKTTLLVNKLHQLYPNHITTRCMKGMTVEQLMVNAVDKLEKFYVSEKQGSTSTQREASIEGSYLALRSQIKTSQQIEVSTRESRVVPVQINPENLAQFIGSKQLCWVIEDFHKVESSEKARLSQLMKIFMDCADDFPNLKIVAIGAVDTARQVVEFDPEMRNRVAEIEVHLMTEQEVKSIIDIGEKKLNLEIPSKIKDLIAQYSSGLGAVCHELCLKLCLAAGVERTATERFTITNEHLQKAVASYVEECSDTIRLQFERARKQKTTSEISHADIILDSLSYFEEGGVARFDLLRQIRKQTPNYPDSALKKHLNDLTKDERGAVVRYNENAMLYSFSNPIFRAYVLTLFHKSAKKTDADKSNGEDLSFDDLIVLLSKQLRSNPDLFNRAVRVERKA